jgi:hypothetical protein
VTSEIRVDAFRITELGDLGSGLINVQGRLIFRLTSALPLALLGNRDASSLAVRIMIGGNAFAYSCWCILYELVAIESWLPCTARHLTVKVASDTATFVYIALCAKGYNEAQLLVLLLCLGSVATITSSASGSAGL